MYRFPLKKAQEIRISEIKDAAVTTYKSMFAKELTDSTTYLNENNMTNNHARIKKRAIDMVIQMVLDKFGPCHLVNVFFNQYFFYQQFNSKLNKEDIELSKEILKKLENELENAYLVFKSENSKKEIAVLVIDNFAYHIKQEKININKNIIGKDSYYKRFGFSSFLYLETTKRKGET